MYKFSPDQSGGYQLPNGSWQGALSLISSNVSTSDPHIKNWAFN